MSEVSFDLEGVLADARTKTGLDNFGSNGYHAANAPGPRTDFRKGLEVLLHTYDTCGYTERGRKRARRRIVDLLAERLRIEEGFRRHPEILAENITQPFFLTGLPRTGTSALLNLLGNDPDFRPMRLWEGMNPSPPDNFRHGETDPRYAVMKAWQEEQEKKNPDFSKIHHTTADTPEECIHLLNHTFEDVQFGVEVLMEPYGSWFQQQDLRPSYHYYADLLRMLQWQRPGQRWLLKTPAHLWALDIITEMFPDACLIITHRNPVEAVTSYASMMAAMLGERIFDRKAFGPVVMEYLARKVESSLKQRENMDSARILDLQFNDFVRDPLDLVHRIYDYFRLPMSTTTEKAFASYAAQHPMGKHGKHEYNFDEFGLNEKQIVDRFGFYIERFNVPMA